MKYILFIILMVISGCSFQPNNSDGIILQKTSKDTIIVSIIDSYYIIKEYNTKEEKDTLFIEIRSVYSPDSENSITTPILIPIKTGISHIKLQNDKVFNIDSIPMSPY